jgi:hypothetical protein
VVTEAPAKGVTLYLKPSTKLLKAAEQAIPGDLWAKVRRSYVFRTRDIPRRADLVLIGGTKAPEVKLEWWAATRGACVCCLPEADDYLGAEVRRALDTGSDLILLDATLRKLVA